MFNEILSAKYLELYQTSRYRDRISWLAETLVRLKYLMVSIVKHVHEWIRFAKYCEDFNIDVPTTFHAPEVTRYLLWRFPKGSGSYYGFIKASIRIFLEADDQGNFSRGVKLPAKPTSVLFNEWAPDYFDFLVQHRGIKETTLQKISFHLREFTDFLKQRNILIMKNLKMSDIHDFCIARGSRKPITWVFYTGTIRRFLRYVFLRGGLEQDLSFAVVRPKSFRFSGINDVLSESEVAKILGCVDRSNAIGRRDYAILLLAARYGIRPSDIRKLSLDEVHWRQGQISFRQSKTGRQLILPLLPEVSEALIDYLRSGRPATQSRSIFVRHKAPFEPFVPENNLSWIMIKALNKAGMDQRRGAKGLYLFRHTLATNMLGAAQPVKTIGDILGHVKTESTFGYMKVDLTHLRSASLSIEEVLHG
jgi:site-specific recombinase XerD